MPHTERFYVSTKTNKVKEVKEANREYFLPDGKKSGKAKYIVEVFGYRHKETAERVRDMVDAAGMGPDLFTIRVETR